MKKNIHIIIIDDEAEARDVLAVLLSAHDLVRVVATAGDAETGLELIQLHEPDLIFLDIQMPGKTGLELVADIHGLAIDAAIVFVTAYDEFAIRAFKVSAFDYLLKPVDPDALADTLKRYSADCRTSDFGLKVDQLLKQMRHDNRVRLATRTGFLMIDPAEIVHATADGNYSVIHLSPSRSEIVSLNLGALFDLLPADEFSRISRSEIVNNSMIFRVDRKKRVCEVRKDGETIILQVSRDFMRFL